jgi:hypothetical protein
MPFDGLPAGLLSDMAKLRVALEGVRDLGWRQEKIGLRDADRHCALGWLLVATDWDRDETVRLALDYVYPALPEHARKEERLQSIYHYNDKGSRKRVVRLFEDAVKLAEAKVTVVR